MTKHEQKHTADKRKLYRHAHGGNQQHPLQPQRQQERKRAADGDQGSGHQHVPGRQHYGCHGAISSMCPRAIRNRVPAMRPACPMSCETRTMAVPCALAS